MQQDSFDAVISKYLIKMLPRVKYLYTKASTKHTYFLSLENSTNPTQEDPENNALRAKKAVQELRFIHNNS
jgi:hypothetical protein